MSSRLYEVTEIVVACVAHIDKHIIDGIQNMVEELPGAA
jgi:hypothetical protein